MRTMFLQPPRTFVNSRVPLLLYFFSNGALSNLNFSLDIWLLLFLHIVKNIYSNNSITCISFCCGCYKIGGFIWFLSYQRGHTGIYLHQLNTQTRRHTNQSINQCHCPDPVFNVSVPA